MKTNNILSAFSFKTSLRRGNITCICSSKSFFLSILSFKIAVKSLTGIEDAIHLTKLLTAALHRLVIRAHERSRWKGNKVYSEWFHPFVNKNQEQKM